LKKALALIFAMVVLLGTAPMVALAEYTDLYATVRRLPPNQFTPEALLAVNGGQTGGYYAYDWEGYADYAFYWVGVINDYDQWYDIVIEGDCIEFNREARLVYADGTVFNGVRETFTDGERLTIVFDQGKMGMRYAVVVPWVTVRGKVESKIREGLNGSANTGHYSVPVDAGGSFRYPVTRAGGVGSVKDILYTDERGDLRLKPNANLPGNGDDTNPPTTENPSSWAVSEVNAAISAGLVPESLQSKYTQTITRAEYCCLAVTLYEKYTGREITDRKTFDDTTDINVEKMAAVGVVDGVGNNKFNPDGQLTREQAATMLARLAEAMGKPLDKIASTFADNVLISSWAIVQVGQVQAVGIMGGVGNNTFAPKSPYSREQSIMTMIRLYNIVK